MYIRWWYCWTKEILKGSIDILLLSIIAKRDTYGYEIAQSLKDASKDLYSMGQELCILL